MADIDGIHEPAETLTVTIKNGHLCVDLDGRSVCDPMPFQMTPERRLVLEQQYYSLDAMARDRGAWSDYHDMGQALGRELAELLFGRTGDNALGVELARCMRKLTRKHYVRVRLGFDEPELSTLPWELALWTTPGTDREIYLGRDCRLALTRCAHQSSDDRDRDLGGANGVFSILNIGTDGSDAETRLYEQTRKFLALIAEHIHGLSATSRKSADLRQFWGDATMVKGWLPEMDIVQWCGHGSGAGLQAPGMGPQDNDTVSPRRLFESTQRAFLYVVIACESGGAIPAPSANSPPTSFSAALIDAGASAVLGMHDVVAQEEFEYLPILYPLLFHGVPLDYGVQYLRRLFALVNGDFDSGPYERWYKLILHASNASDLDGKRFRLGAQPWNAFQSVPVLLEKFRLVLERDCAAESRRAAELAAAGRGRERAATEAYLRTRRRMEKLAIMLMQLDSPELCDRNKEK